MLLKPFARHPGFQRFAVARLALYQLAPHILRMSDPVTRLNAALEGRYTIERELGSRNSGHPVIEELNQR